MSLAARTKRALAGLDFRPRRDRGQSFLIDPSIGQRIAEAVCGQDCPNVLEIGSGLGALTDALAEGAARVVAVEIEPAFVALLGEWFGDRHHVTVLAGDALEADYHALTEGAPPDWRVAGNLPYRSASAILLRLLMVKPPFFRLVVMVQREVGERLTARPGDEQYGSLSVITAYHVASAATVLRVPRGAFFPQPKVDSVVLSLQPRPTPWPEVLDESVLSAAIRAGFGQRRKQLANALAGGSGSAAVTGGIAAAALAQVGLPPRVRAEELDVHQFIALSNALVGQGVRAGGDG